MHQTIFQLYSAGNAFTLLDRFEPRRINRLFPSSDSAFCREASIFGKVFAPLPEIIMETLALFAFVLFGSPKLDNRWIST